MAFRVRHSIDFLGRVLLVAAFVVSMPIKETNFPQLINAISSQGVSIEMSTFLLVSAIVFLISGLSLVLFSRYQKIGASLLLVFILPTAIFFRVNSFQTSVISMNLGLIGGLTLVLTRNQPQRGFENFIKWKKAIRKLNSRF